MKPKCWANLFKYIFFALFFCLLLHRLAVRISLPFYIFYSYYCTDPGLRIIYILAGNRLLEGVFCNGASRPSEEGVGGGGGSHPDSEIRGGACLKKKLFSAFRASFWSKNKEGQGPPGPSRGSATILFRFELNH